MNDLHIPVLLEEVIAGLKIKAWGNYMDVTFGRGGHSQAILAQLNEAGHVYALDRDPAAIQYAHEQQALREDKRFFIKQSAFANLEKVAEELGISGKVNGILMDLGVSSPQIESPERGFSFLRDGPLDMRMDPSCGVSAADWLASADMHDIAHVIKTYGEERFAKKIARKIIAEREKAPIVRTRELADLIKQILPRAEKGAIHPATRTFQAIRIYINHELEQLKQALNAALNILAEHGRLVVISFHSLEDRIVKRFMRQHARGDKYPKEIPITIDKIKAPLKLCGVVRPSKDNEVKNNIRSRSAILRIAEKVS